MSLYLGENMIEKHDGFQMKMKYILHYIIILFFTFGLAWLSCTRKLTFSHSEACHTDSGIKCMIFLYCMYKVGKFTVLLC